MVHKYFIIITLTLATLISSTAKGQEKVKGENLVLNSIDFSKKVSFTGIIPGTATFANTLTIPPSFSMEKKSLVFPAVSIDLENIKPLYINKDFKPVLDYTHYLYCNPNMSSKDLMENIAVDYLVNQYVGCFKLIKSKCNSKK